jgi:hypothetical protein
VSTGWTILIVLAASFGFGGPLALMLLIAEIDDSQRNKRRGGTE